MNPNQDILIVAVKSTVRAFDKTNGTELWSTKLGSGMGATFVSVIADTKRVYAHTHGELYCLDLKTGRVLWHDALAGMGYGIASMAFPGVGLTGVAPAAAQAEADHAQAAATASG